MFFEGRDVNNLKEHQRKNFPWIRFAIDLLIHEKMDQLSSTELELLKSNLHPFNCRRRLLEPIFSSSKLFDIKKYLQWVVFFKGEFQKEDIQSLLKKNPFAWRIGFPRWFLDLFSKKDWVQWGLASASTSPSFFAEIKCPWTFPLPDPFFTSTFHFLTTVPFIRQNPFYTQQVKRNVLLTIRSEEMFQKVLNRKMLTPFDFQEDQAWICSRFENLNISYALQLGAIKITRKLLFRFGGNEKLLRAALNFQRGGPWMDEDVDPIFVGDVAFSDGRNSQLSYITMSERFGGGNLWRDPPSFSRLYPLSLAIKDSKALYFAVVERKLGEPLLFCQSYPQAIVIGNLQTKMFCGQIPFSNCKGLKVLPSQRYLVVQDDKSIHFYDLYPLFSNQEAILKGSISNTTNKFVRIKDNEFFLGEEKFSLPFRWQAFRSHPVGALSFHISHFPIRLLKRVAGIFL
jgi:hypothetical protein